MEDNNILCAIEDERVTRRKHGLYWWYDIPCKASLDYCLDSTNRAMNEIDYIVTNDIMPNRIKSHFKNIIYYNHHLLHAASMYYFTKEKNLSIAVVDGMGSYTDDDSLDKGYRLRETISLYNANDNKIDLIKKLSGKMPKEVDSFSKGISNSLGYFYNLITKLSGFGKLEDGKTMGLAAYGEPVYYDLMKKYITISQDIDQIFIFKPFESDFISDVVSILSANNYSFQVRADIAASGQKIFEETMMNLVHILEDKNPKNNISISGGCALNSVANGKIKDYLNKKGKDLILFPHVSDAGQAFGAVTYHYNKLRDTKDTILIDNSNNTRKVARLGKKYSKKEIKSAINNFYPHIEYSIVTSPEKVIAQLLNEGEVVAFFEGQSEFGPRALGGRSILASPTDIKFRELINRRIKNREPFRPIAPMVIDKYYQDYFKGENSREFMLEIASVKEEKKDTIPTVVHFDSTARVQTIFQEESPLIYSIIDEFYKLTTIPIITNTSFNRKSEPIVETPKNAVEAFLGMKELNYLYLDGFLIKKSKITPKVY
jgi:carbamoyltransferase